MHFSNAEQAMQFYVEYKSGATGAGCTARVLAHIQNTAASNKGRSDADSSPTAAVDIEKLLKQFTEPYQFLLLDLGLGGKDYACQRAYERHCGNADGTLLMAIKDALCPETFLPALNVTIKSFENKLKATGYMGKGKRPRPKTRAA